MKSFRIPITNNPEGLPDLTKVRLGRVTLHFRFFWSDTEKILYASILDEGKQPLESGLPMYLGQNALGGLVHPKLKGYVFTLDTLTPGRFKGPYTRDELGVSVYPVLSIPEIQGAE